MSRTQSLAPHLRRNARRLPPTPHWDSGIGFCRWCGNEVFNKLAQRSTRALWHKECAEIYLIATRYRKYVKKRDKGRCRTCSVVWKRGDKPWVADHIHPLHKVDRDDYPACLHYWSLANLQTLCHECSHTKTVAELKAIHAKPVPAVVPEAPQWAYIYPSTGVTIDG